MWAVLVAAFTTVLSLFLPRLLMGLGLFAVTALSTDSILHSLSDKVFGRLSAAGSFGGINLVSTWQYLGVYDLVSIWLAAYAAAFAIKRLKNAAATAANAAMGAAASKANKVT